jgi:hypothetical protein
MVPGDTAATDTYLSTLLSSARTANTLNGTTPEAQMTGVTTLGGATLVLQLSGVAGSINNIVNPAQPLADLSTTVTYSVAGANGSGYGYFNATGGSAQSQFNQGQLATDAGTGKTANVSIVFNTTTNTSIDSWYNTTWTVADADPVHATVVPEPTSMLAGLACLMPIVGMVMGRRRKAQGLTETCAIA